MNSIKGHKILNCRISFETALSIFPPFKDLTEKKDTLTWDGGRDGTPSSSQSTIKNRNNNRSKSQLFLVIVNFFLLFEHLLTRTLFTYSTPYITATWCHVSIQPAAARSESR